jgi:hypothetical protein
MPSGSVLDARHGEFITGGVSILVASRDAANRPVVCRASGCETRSDGRVDLLLDATRAQQVLDAIAGSGMVAAVFSEPPTHRTIQLKGNDAEIGRCDGARRQQLVAHADAFAATLAKLGYRETMARELVYADPGEVAVVTFTPTRIFDQTPGPHAGEPMSAR